MHKVSTIYGTIRRAALYVLDATVILYMMLNLIMVINPASRALTNITDHIGAAYSAASVPHNILIPDWAWGFTLLIVRGVICWINCLNTYKLTSIRN